MRPPFENHFLCGVIIPNADILHFAWCCFGDFQPLSIGGMRHSGRSIPTCFLPSRCKEACEVFCLAMPATTVFLKKNRDLPFYPRLQHPISRTEVTFYHWYSLAQSYKITSDVVPSQLPNSENFFHKTSSMRPLIPFFSRKLTGCCLALIGVIF